MPLLPGCPRCPDPLSDEARFLCGVHGAVAPVWRPDEPSYDELGAHLRLADGLPTLVPWPLGPGWRVSDFAAVRSPAASPRATLAACSGASELDGPVDVIVVSEEPGTGLGARCAGLPAADPGVEGGPAVVRLRVGGQTVPLWPLSTAESTTAPGVEDARSVLVGEAFGRWLWLLLQPASAMLLLREEWQLHDLSQVGPTLVELTFGGPAPRW